MKQVLLGILALLLLKATNGDSTAYLQRFNALKFGQTDQDYIMYKPEMRSSQTAFTVCAWIRRLRSSTRPVWFSYAVRSDGKDIQITDDGYNFYMFGVHSDLQSVYNVSSGTWFHNCLTWDSASQTRNMYINGMLVDSKATPAGETLGQDGYLVLGNEQDGPGTGMDSSEIFGGELYKLNMFSKKLSQSEVQDMATDICSEVEETYADARSIKWEDILLKTRHGTVTEIGTTCPGVIILQIKERLNSTLEELELIKQEKETYRNKLKSKERQLNTTEAQKQTKKEDLDKTIIELNSTAAALNHTQTELQRVKDLLEEAISAPQDCPLNSTVTSYWDLLYSDDFLGGTVTTEKLGVLRKSIKKLGNCITCFLYMY